MSRKIMLASLLPFIVLSMVSCKACKFRDESKVGTGSVPLKLAFMPAPVEDEVKAGAKLVVDDLSRASGLKIELVIAKKYMAVIDGLASRTIDVAFINSLGYLLSHDWSGTEALFQLKGEDGKNVYKTAIIVRADSGIKTMKDINGRSFAFTDPYSMSGYLMPLYLFNENGVKPAKTVFAGGSSEVVEMVYSGKVDAGAIYYAEHDPDGRIHDARAKLVDKYPDMVDKVAIIALSPPIPTTPVVFRKGLMPDVVKKLEGAFIALNQDQEAIGLLYKMYGATGILKADEKSYDGIRDILKELGKELKEVVPGAVDFYKTHVWEVAPAL